jgi:FAD/FMN-containing dehydrogenase
MLNVPMGQSGSWPAQGGAGETSVRLRLFLACGLAREAARPSGKAPVLAGARVGEISLGAGGCNGRPFEQPLKLEVDCKWKLSSVR